MSQVTHTRAPRTREVFHINDLNIIFMKTISKEGVLKTASTILSGIMANPAAKLDSKMIEEYSKRALEAAVKLAMLTPDDEESFKSYVDKMQKKDEEFKRFVEFLSQE